MYKSLFYDSVRSWQFWVCCVQNISAESVKREIVSSLHITKLSSFSSFTFVHSYGPLMQILRLKFCSFILPRPAVSSVPQQLQGTPVGFLYITRIDAAALLHEDPTLVPELSLFKTSCGFSQERRFMFSCQGTTRLSVIDV